MEMNLKEREKFFKKLIDKDKLSHFYIFWGNEKEIFDFSLALVNYLENKKFEKPKNILRETLIINQAEKDNNSSISIDKVRTIIDFLYQKPIFSSKRAVIIFRAQELTLAAQSAILKIAEEPPPYSLIIFINSTKDSIILPLRSRAQSFYFPISIKNQSLSFDKKIIEKFILKKLTKEEIEKISLTNLDNFFKSLIIELRRRKNFLCLKKVVERLVFLKRYNLNVKLQLKCLNKELLELMKVEKIKGRAIIDIFFLVAFWSLVALALYYFRDQIFFWIANSSIIKLIISYIY